MRRTVPARVRAGTVQRAAGGGCKLPAVDHVRLGKVLATSRSVTSAASGAHARENHLRRNTALRDSRPETRPAVLLPARPPLQRCNGGRSRAISEAETSAKPAPGTPQVLASHVLTSHDWRRRRFDGWIAAGERAGFRRVHCVHCWHRLRNSPCSR